MRRLGLVSVLLCGFVSPAWAESPIDTTEEGEESAEDMRFRALASLGDGERTAGHLRAAARAYMAALDVRSDPLVGGRLGVLFVQLGRPELAPELLLDAIHRASTTPKEREGFFKAHEAARAQGSWIELIVSHAGAQVTLDGEPKDTGGHTASWFFVRAGEHVVRAKLDGYEEAVETFTALKGEDRPVRITLKPLPAPPPSEPAVYAPESVTSRPRTATRRASWAATATTWSFSKSTAATRSSTRRPRRARARARTRKGHAPSSPRRSKSAPARARRTGPPRSLLADPPAGTARARA
ncbi:PEGA domain-containing protein [Polyangium sorediatum]|uniref:PEGA domain-containing protein n=1 Tax=Polyangium sorediatum TaxID=889274 RepID=A0ABT6NV33_9BACT|nr:PEGA domain-containing protein [Polyangium sorediatum]MDI1432151.1 PEGA domain-containing protein [Polyangium sorediatum]